MGSQSFGYKPPSAALLVDCTSSNQQPRQKLTVVTVHINTRQSSASGHPAWLERKSVMGNDLLTGAVQNRGETKHNQRNQTNSTCQIAQIQTALKRRGDNLFC